MSLSKSSISSQQNLTEPNSQIDYTYEFEDFRLDAAHLMLYHGRKTISLKPKVVETLVALVERRGEVVSNDELMKRLWADSFVEESNLTQNIYLLRKTLGNCIDGQPFIENFARRGYRFNGKITTPVEVELLLATHTKTQTFIEEETVEHKGNRPRRAWLIPALIAITTFVVIAVAVKQFVPNQGNSAATRFQTMKFIRHSDSSDVTRAVISPDGKFIAYNDNKNALWLKNVATDSNVKILQDSAEGQSVAAISPDDNHIYFAKNHKDKRVEILRMPLFGGTAQQKISEDNWSGIALSPDGDHLSFIRGGGDTEKHELIIANTDGTGERSLAVSKDGGWFGMWGQSSAWSPDGSKIAYTGGMTSDGKAIWEIRIIRVADGKEISLIKPEPGARGIDAVAWLPDGDNLIAILGDNNSQGQIYQHTLSTGEWRRVTNDLSNYVGLSLTTDAKTVITIKHENPGNLWILPADGDASQARQITFGRNLMTDNTGVSWTPDGKIVYASNTGARWEIWSIGADGADQKQLTQNCAGNDTCSQPVVTPDGRYIVFQATLDGVRNIWRMNADGSNPKQMTTDGGYSPSISNDGLSVIYARYAPVSMLWHVPIEGGAAEQFSKIASVASAGFSPDGKQMAFGYYDARAKQPFQTCVATIAADAPEKCFAISRSFPRWAPDGRSFYYLDHSYLGIWKQPLDGERTKFLEFPGERTNNFAFSPDGKSLVVARSKPTQDIVALTDGN